MKIISKKRCLAYRIWPNWMRPFFRIILPKENVLNLQEYAFRTLRHFKMKKNIWNLFFLKRTSPSIPMQLVSLGAVQNLNYSCCWLWVEPMIVGDPGLTTKSAWPNQDFFMYYIITLLALRSALGFTCYVLCPLLRTDGQISMDVHTDRLTDTSVTCPSMGLCCGF